jgi:hypothetical protein
MALFLCNAVEALAPEIFREIKRALDGIAQYTAGVEKQARKLRAGLLTSPACGE